MRKTFHVLVSSGTDKSERLTAFSVPLFIYNDVIVF